MLFSIADAMPILKRTPGVLDAWLRGLPDAWLRANEGADTWSAFDVLGHLIHGEQTDWIPRLRILLEHGPARTFAPFDRPAQRGNRGRTTAALLDEFPRLRGESLAALDACGLTGADHARRGTHPAFGGVTLGELLATWTVHDLGHIAQIARVMAFQYADQVGPWREYLPILHPRSVTP